MPDLPKRTLGRTGMEVTTLGYGAMELRGAPRGRDVSEEQADRDSQRGPRRRDQLHRHVDRLRHGRRAHRPVHLAPAGEYFLASQVRLPGRRSRREPAARPRRSAQRHVFTAENIRAGVEQSLRRMKTDHLDLVQFHAIAFQERSWRSTARIDRCCDAAEGGQGPLHRHVRNAAQPARSHRDGRLRRVPDPLLRPAARARGRSSPRLRSWAQASSSAAAPLRADRAKRKATSGRPGSESASTTCSGDMSRMEFILRFTYTNPDLDTTIVGTLTRITCRTTSTRCSRARCRPTSTRKPSVAWPWRVPYRYPMPLP